MKRILGILSLLVTSIQATVDDVWLNQVLSNVDKDGVEWLREHLKEELEFKKPAATMNFPVLPIGKCQTASTPSLSNPRLIVCLSFSVPDTTWLTLGKDLEALEGVIVLRGLPNNSFPELAKRLVNLREKGFMAQVELNPLIFQEYQVTKVPTFVLPSEDQFDKLSGNISIRAALEQFEIQGETSKAAALLDLIKCKQDVF